MRRRDYWKALGIREPLKWEDLYREWGNPLKVDLETDPELIEYRRIYAIHYAELFYIWPLGYDYCWHQAEWLTIFQEIPNVMLVGPTNHGKTTVLGAYTLWCIFRNPNIRCGYISYEESQTEGTSRVLQTHIEENPDLIKNFGMIKPKKPRKWADLEWIVNRSQKFTVKDATFLGKGLGGELQNRRLDLACLDDVVSFKTYETPSELQPSRVIVWFNEVLQTRLEPEGEIKIIGSFVDYRDLYNYILSGENEDGVRMCEVILPIRYRALRDSRYQDFVTIGGSK